MNKKIKLDLKDKGIKFESVFKAVSAILTALLLLVTISLVVVTKDNQKQIKSLQERIETITKNSTENPDANKDLKDSQITKKYMIDDDCMIEVWDSQFKTLRLYTVDFDEWELLKVGEVW